MVESGIADDIRNYVSRLVSLVIVIENFCLEKSIFDL